MAKSLRKTTLSTLVAGLGQFALNLGIGIITARMLGPHDRGIFALGAVLPHTVVALVKGGLAQASIYSIRREKTDPGVVAFHVLVIGVFALQFAATAFGNAGHITPLLAAWLPIFVVLPSSVLSMEAMRT